MRDIAKASDTCIYTIRHIDALRQAYESGGATWNERKVWKTAIELVNKQRGTGYWVPIFFAAAEAVSGLLYVATLDSVEAKRTNIDYTEYMFSDMYKLTGRTPISELRLVETGESLSSEFIRPYAICRTPANPYDL